MMYALIVENETYAAPGEGADTPDNWSVIALRGASSSKRIISYGVDVKAAEKHLLSISELCKDGFRRSATPEIDRMIEKLPERF